MVGKTLNPPILSVLVSVHSNKNTIIRKANPSCEAVLLGAVSDSNKHSLGRKSTKANNNAHVITVAASYDNCFSRLPLF